VLFPHNESTKDFAHEKGTKAPEGAATGAGSGAVVGGRGGLVSWSWLYCYSGCGAVPRRRTYYGRIGGSRRPWRGGWIDGALIGAGIPEYEAKRYEGRIKKGGILLSVPGSVSFFVRGFCCANWNPLRRVVAVMRRMGPKVLRRSALRIVESPAAKTNP
jgi:hypothetical protein